MTKGKKSKKCILCDNLEDCENKGLKFEGSGEQEAANCENYSTEWIDEPLIWVGPEGATHKELYARDND